MKNLRKSQHEKESVSKLRIIGGVWRSRKIRFLSLPGLRPTPNRIRETLFNWLTPAVRGARCLDLFAGSGALSFEALSRGAQAAVMIDQSPEIIAVLQENAALLKTNAAEFYCATFPQGLEQLHLTPFDIVFLDPPFRQQLLASCCQWLEQHHWLKPNALIYIEAEAELEPLPIPSHWQVLHSKKAGAVGYYLLKTS
ncbi:MAG: 16S rRNA (guanine(966)-N(2))-methyltransferase RsmD [Gammaproteobacteria bacterium]